MTDLDALYVAVRLHPHDELLRLALADELERTDATVECPECSHYAKDHPCPWCEGRKIVRAVPYVTKCEMCQGTGNMPPGYRAERNPASGRHEGGATNCKTCNCAYPMTPGVRPNHHGKLAELIRVGMELAKMGEEPSRSTFTILAMNTLMDGMSRLERGGNRDELHQIAGVLGYDMRESWIKDRDALRATERELIEFGRTVGWWYIEGLTRPSWAAGTYGTETVGPWWEDSEGRRIEGTVRRGFLDRISLPAAAFTEQLARAVWERHPVTECVLTDAEPYQGQASDEFRHRWWWVAESMNGSAAHTVRDDIWRLVSENLIQSKTFFTREAALAALSAACVNWGRNLVGLPPLKHTGCQR